MEGSRPRRKETPRRGLTRRLRRGWWGCRPEGGSPFFRSERKDQRKHAARRLREKALYCPFLKEGVRNVARNLVGELTHAIVRARAHSFPLSKRARLFPSAAYRRSSPPQAALDKLNPCELGCRIAAWRASPHGKTGLFFSPAAGAIHTQISLLRMLQCILNIFSTQKASVGSCPCWPLLRAEGLVARRRSFLVNKQEIHTRPASRGTCRATAVKPRPSRMFPYTPARIARSPKGAQPLGRLVSSRAIRQVCLERSMCLRIRRSKLSRSFCST